MQDAEPAVRAAAAIALGRYVYWSELGNIAPHFSEEATDALWESLHNPSEHIEVRRRALESMAASSDPRVTRAIENAYYGAEHLMRVSALAAMGASADPNWIPSLLPEIKQSDAELRLEAVRALGELEARSAVPYVIAMIEEEGVVEVLLAALTALGQMGGQQARQRAGSHHRL